MLKLLLISVALVIGITITAQAGPLDALAIVSGYEKGSNEAGSVGSGFLVTAPSGRVLIITNEHVCGAIEEENLLPAVVLVTATVKAKYVKRNVATDLCALEVENPLHLVDTDTLQVSDEPAIAGDEVVTMGFPGARPPLAVAIRRVMGEEGIPVPPRAVEGSMLISGKVVGGESGSPVVNIRGQVVGVIYALYMGVAGAFIPLKDLKELLEGL